MTCQRAAAAALSGYFHRRHSGPGVLHQVVTQARIELNASVSPDQKSVPLAGFTQGGTLSYQSAIFLEDSQLDPIHTSIVLDDIQCSARFVRVPDLKDGLVAHMARVPVCHFNAVWCPDELDCAFGRIVPNHLIRKTLAGQVVGEIVLSDGRGDHIDSNLYSADRDAVEVLIQHLKLAADIPRAKVRK